MRCGFRPAGTTSTVRSSASGRRDEPARRPAGLPPRAEITGPGPQFELFNRASFCRFSRALDRPYFFYRNQPVNRRFTPRYRRRAPGLYIAPVARKHAPAGGRYEDAAIPEIAGAAASGNGNTILSERAFAAA